MKQEILKKWEEIYYYAGLIVELDPWSRFEEKDIFALCPKNKREEHFFSFLKESCGRCGIAIYRNGQSYCHAQERLHGKNSKKEPVFLLQDAVIFLLGDREDVSKKNYAVIKELGLKCRGRGGWPYFEKYQVGFAPQEIPEDELDMLLDDLGNLWVMVHLIAEGKIVVDFANREVMTRTYSPSDDTFYSYPSKLQKPLVAKHTVITMQDNEWLNNLRKLPSKGTISLDWSYLPTVVKDEGIDIVPRLLMAVENQSGCILCATMLPPSDVPHEDLVDELMELIEKRGKPAVIEICDKEIECYIADLCKQVKIRLEVKPQLKQLSMARREMLKEFRRT